ncbi:MAG: FAD-dependent oxidoreductase [bacterium]|nr:FAD-dependent oxidoreductase [bacterium]
MERKNIAVIGAGFGGLRTALLIGKKVKKLKLETSYRIVLIDQNEYQTYTPMLYEVATNDPEHTSYAKLREIVTVPIQNLTTGLPIDFVSSAVQSVDLKRGIIACADASPIRYEYLVLAPGSESNYFDIPGLEKFATPLKTFRDSIEIRECILTARERKMETMRVVIGGGGSAGVELAGEVRSWLNKIQVESGNVQKSEVLIIEAAPTILDSFPTGVITRAIKRLARIGIKTILNEKIVSVSDHLITLATGRTVHFDVLVWTGGVKPAALIDSLELAKDKRGRVLVSETMECLPERYANPDVGRVYGLGDAVLVIDKKTNRPIPGTAHAALIEADIVAHNILEEIQLSEGVGASPSFKTYIPADYPYIIPIGGKYAIARIGKIIISGFFGWILKGIVELGYLWSIMPFTQALKLCIKGFRIIVKNDRIAGN